jgi:secreted trypsin-like serine protease
MRSIWTANLRHGHRHPEGLPPGRQWRPLFAVSSEGPVQVGIASWAHSCADDLFPGIYTRVSSYEDWIANTMKDADAQTTSR